MPLCIHVLPKSKNKSQWGKGKQNQISFCHLISETVLNVQHSDIGFKYILFLFLKIIDYSFRNCHLVSSIFEFKMPY